MKHLLIGLLSLAVLSCGTAPDGFYAPVGSEIAGPDGGSYVVPPGGYVRVITSFTVTVPVGESGTDSGNNIFTTAVCFQCDIYDWIGDAGRAEKDMDQIEQMVNPYALKTDSRGIYTLVVHLQGPPSVDDDYEAVLNLDIGTANVDVTYKVTGE